MASSRRRPEIGYSAIRVIYIWEYPPECRGCKRWKALHKQLVDALQFKLSPWQVTCIPPPGGPNDDEWAVALQLELEQASSSAGNGEMLDNPTWSTRILQQVLIPTPSPWFQANDARRCVINATL
jgi:hypothetical protein